MRSAQPGGFGGGILLVLGSLVSIAATGFASWLFLNHDAAAYLTLSDRFLDGLRLYDETRTPTQLILVALHAVPAFLARHSPLSIVTSFHLFLFVLLGACALQNWRVLGETPRLGDAPARSAIVAVALASLFLLPFAWANDFGQREQMFCALVTPYFLLCARHLLGAAPPHRLDAAATGVLAAIGFAIKPHFFVLLAACELTLLVRKRDVRIFRRPEIVAAFGFFALYGAFWAASYPEVFPLIGRFAFAYSAFDADPAQRFGLFFGPACVALVFAGMLLLPSTRRDAAYRSVLALGTAAIAASAAIFWLQSGFTYHLLPLVYFEVLGVALLLSLRGAQRMLIAVAILLGVLIANDFRGALPRQLEDRRHVRKLTELVESRISGQRVLVLSTGMFPWYSVIAHAESRSTGSLWFLTYLNAAYAGQLDASREPRYHTPERMSDDERFFHEALMRDFSSATPDVVVVSTGPFPPGMRGMRFDILRHFGKDPRFTASWREFRPFLEAADFAFYERVGGGSAPVPERRAGRP